MAVNSREARRLMKEKGLNPRPRRRSVRTTDGDHGRPIIPLTYNESEVHDQDQLWGPT
ncbi:hypothetical protein CDO87_23045 (plasmid) [Sagittula sp. P11]|uniref:hypothetical protein n=1 Tax=Sagittula sp. P11 TaxID=2009329 RepID=UPI000CA101AC|nr:hypothetical protein CDO87_23045 [Sagittula sp. P11]